MICTCNYSVIISLCNLGNIGLDNKVIIIIRGNKSKLNYIEQNKISSRLNKQHHGQLMLLLMKQSTTLGYVNSHKFVMYICTLSYCIVYFVYLYFQVHCYGVLRLNVR
jgi:hypothetical protein